MKKKIVYARLFVKEYLPQIKIKHDYIKYCKIISPLLIYSYMAFTINFRLINEIDDNFTKHFILIHHNLIECLFILFLIIPYIPRKFPENFNEFIFDNLENLVKILLKFYLFY